MKKIQVRALHEEAASRIREMIREGVLNKGSKLVEANLCAAIGVSRTPLREALRVLSAEGLVRMVPNRGAFVSEPSMAELREMFEVMGVLEGTCARMAVERMTQASLLKLERLHEKLEDHYRDGDREGYIKTNNLYHALVQELTGNKTLNDIISGLREKISLYRYRQIFEPNRFGDSIQEHRDILEAFRRKDADAADALMRKHLLKQGEALLKVYERKERTRQTA